MADEVTSQSPLAYRDYRNLWGANALSNFGSQIQVVGAGWLMASLTNSPQMIALVQTSINLPTVCIILFGGALADKYDRRMIMLTTQTAMLFTATILAILSWQHVITPWGLLGLIFFTSAFGSVNNPSWQASVRDILPRALISKAVALNSMSINLARTAGPALGGLIVMAIGIPAAFMANAMSFVLFIVALLRWHPAARLVRATDENLFAAMMFGIRYVAKERNVRHAVIRGGLSGLSASAVFSLMPVLAKQKLGGNAFDFGLLLAGFGGGAVVSAYIAGQLRARLSMDQVVRVATVSLTLGLLLLAWAGSLWLAVIGAALGGSGWTMSHSTLNTSVQLSAAQSVTARALATYQTGTFAGMSAGTLLFGWVAEHQGLFTAYAAAAALHAVGGLIGLALPLPRLQDFDGTQRVPIGK